MVFSESFSDVEFTHEVGGEGGRVLVGDARVLGRPIKMTTLLEFNPDRQIREIWVMVRPLSGVVAIAEAIGSPLAKRRGLPGLRAAVRALLKILAGQAAATNWVGSRLIAALNRSHAQTKTRTPGVTALARVRCTVFTLVATRL
jgi:hypothetical protein